MRALLVLFCAAVAAAASRGYGSHGIGGYGGRPHIAGAGFGVNAGHGIGHGIGHGVGYGASHGLGHGIYRPGVSGFGVASTVVIGGHGHGSYGYGHRPYGYGSRPYGYGYGRSAGTDIKAEETKA